jgi:hypothetical protein
VQREVRDLPRRASVSALADEEVPRLCVFCRETDERARLRLGGRLCRRPTPRAALSANVSETATPTEFSVEGRAWTSR